jgi:hypothetical protein
MKMNVSLDWTENDWDSFAVWLKHMLIASEGVITFTKSDGTERVMKCTLKPEQLPKVEIKEGAKPRKESTTSIRVFDLEKNEWRSFTVKKVKQVNFTIE